jgi:hypothetical protein
MVKKGTENLKPGDARALAESRAADRRHRDALDNDPEYAKASRARTEEAMEAMFPANEKECIRDLIMACEMALPWISAQVEYPGDPCEKIANRMQAAITKAEKVV